MKSIKDYINIDESQEQQIDEGLADVLRIGTEIALLSGVIALFVKSVKDIAQGENGFINIIKKLKEDIKIQRICNKLAKNKDIKHVVIDATKFSKEERDEYLKWLQEILSKKEYEYLTTTTKKVVDEQK